MKQFLTLPLFLAAGVLASPATRAGESLSEPSSSRPYTLFHPTPRQQWRDLSPDRPDTTESPITVDAGAWVVEASFFDWRRDKGNHSYTVMATNLKVGLTDRIDFQTVFDTYTWQDPATGAGSEGFGDVTLRLKYNLWGNDGGKTGFALFPFLKIPTDTAISNGVVEGGLILPYSIDLADGIGLGLMAEFDAVHDGVTDYDLEFVHSAVLGFDLTERLGLFTEYIGVAGPTPYQVYASTGLTFAIHRDFVLDTGVQIGLNDAAEDIGVFAGFTKRF
ncbi:MAG: transporter [Verrucomicrobiaceae bacterium]|nr:transporter [Verrucomicrobiaceae bacterium]